MMHLKFDEMWDLNLMFTCCVESVSPFMISKELRV